MRSLTAGVLVIWAGSFTQAAEKVGFRQVTATHPVAVQRGTKAEVRLRSNLTLDETHAVLFARGGIRMTYAEPKPIAVPLGNRTSPGTPFRFQGEVPADQLPGVYEYRVATKQAVSSVAQLLVTDYGVTVETTAENGTAATAQQVSIPAALCGVCERMEDVDCYRFAGKAGQELTVEIFAQRVTDRIHGMVVRGPTIYLMDPILTLYGPSGQVVAQNDNFHGGDSFLHVKLPVAGDYTLEVRDARYAGDQRYSYCVEIADRPYAHSAFPPAVQAGQTAEVEAIGHMLGTQRAVAKLSAGADAPGIVRRRLATPAGETNPVPVLVSPYSQLVERSGASPSPDQRSAAAAKPTPVNLPAGVNGRLSQDDEVDRYVFTARKGAAYRFEVFARRLGSPLDSVIEIYDLAGKPVTEADDGDLFRAKDSRLTWTAPADGQYVVAVRDLHARGGERFVYHLQAEPAEPDFELMGEYYYAMLAPGTRMIWFAKIDRQNGLEAPVAIELENLPPGVTQTPVTIPPGMSQCAIILSAAKDAPIGASLVRVCGKATVRGADGREQQLVRYGRVTCEQQNAGGGQARWPIETQIVGVVRPMDLLSVTATPEEVTVSPGKPAEIAVRIERSKEYADAVTLDMEFKYFTQVFGAQLPPGVTMSANSKTRLTGNVLEGKIILEAAPTAVAVERLPVAVVAQVSISFSVNTNYASNPVWLTVKK
jgi:hypothetical protein